jgi:hypothetical protein
MKRTHPYILVQGPSRGNSQIVPIDRNAVVGGNSTSKSIASHTTKRSNCTKRGAGAHSAGVPNGVGQRPRGVRSAMGEFTVVKEGENWIVLEDGRRVGGTLRCPFPSREAAERYVERELAGEAEINAKGDFALSAKTRVIRETDAELWQQFVNIEEEFADEDEAAREAAHRAAGTFIVMIRLVMAGLEANGKIYRTGKMRNGRPLFALSNLGKDALITAARRASHRRPLKGALS